MARDLFEELGINPNEQDNPRDLLSEYGGQEGTQDQSVGQSIQELLRQFGSSGLPGSTAVNAGLDVFNLPPVKGAVKGFGQEIGDTGASVLNWPLEGLEALTGKEMPRVPHPQLTNENPESLGESVGQNIGQLLGAFALPGGAGVKAAQLANKGYKALAAGKELPFLGKMLAASGGGALEGAAGNEENRALGGALGSMAGGASHAIPAGIQFGKSIGSTNIANEISQELKRLTGDFNNKFTTALQEGEEAGADAFLKKPKANFKLFKKAGEDKLAYGLAKFLEEPTLSNAHKAQSDLNKIATKYKRSKEGSLESDVYDQALKLKNNILMNITEAFEKSGAKEAGQGYEAARSGYAKEVAPYLNSPAINSLLGKNKRGVQTLRPKEFADKLLKEEDFLAEAGNKHSGLLRREKYNRLKGGLVGHAASTAGGALAGSLMPYNVSKLLGL